MLSPLTHDDPAGFGAYRLIARLGSGGMGTVYLARSAGGRTAALKTMHAGIATDPGFRTRFRLETDAARIIGGHHGAIVVDADPQAETPWLATEYVLGPPLDDAVALAGPLPETSIRALGAALAGALAQLHASDVVHRDLKPSNVMVTAYGPKIIDFGIARAAGDDRLTRTGAAAGTPAFMSPEQATGQEHTPAGDVFALAGVLVHAATGHGPFGAGQAADLLYRVRYADPDLTGVPDTLVPILTRCLSKDPSQRPSTWELGTQLHDGQGQFADHLPDTVLAEIARRATEVWQHQPYRLPAPAYTTSAHTTRQAPALSRRKLLTVGGSSILGVAAAGAGAWAWLGPDANEPKPVASGPSPTGSVEPQPDYAWQIQVGQPSGLDLFPGSASVPFPVGDQVVLAIGNGFAGVEASTGAGKWTTGKLEDNWTVTSDGEQVYRIGELKESVGHKGKAWPLVVESLDLTTGKAKKRLPLIQEFNGVVVENQLICASGGAIYLAAAGKERDKEWPGFDSGQSWSLAAVDIRTGKVLWSHSLPRRPDKSDRLHFLAGRVVGDRLILLQETNQGSVRVVAHNSRTGAVLWDKPANVQPEQVRERLVTDSQHVFMGTGPLRALRLTDGGEAWSLAKSRPGTVCGPPTVKNGLVCAVQRGLGVIAVNATNGTVRWEEKGGEGTKADLTDAPVVGAKYVYSKGPSGLRAINMSSRTTAKTYKTVGTRFFGHESAKVVIAYGHRFLAAFPLQ
ncbi:protein kinase [Streptomyces sp. NPDC002730]|uniref:protein kinase domain-containing protein n=1 Tax=Streptomyces sp. NPDC002730 TaxID=3364662 RepID=UPI00369BC1FC